MRADRGRWAFVRLALTCPRCAAETVQRIPEAITACSACDAPIPVVDYPRIAAETGAPLDRLAWGATRSTPGLVIGRQQPLCWACGAAVPLSAADLGAEHAIHCSACDAITETAPAPEWLRMHLPDALQLYFAPARRGEGAREAIWMRCAACDAGMRVDADTARISRCGACHAQNHVPDVIWQALHPVRHGAPWCVLFEALSPAQRAARMQDRTALTEAIEGIGQPDRDVQATVDRLRRDGSRVAEDALFAALRAPSPAWFAAALASLAAATTPAIQARLVEALDQESDPIRQHALARAIEPARPEVARAAYAQLVESAPSATAAQALAAWARLDPGAALTRAEALAADAPLAVRREAARLLIEQRRVPFGGGMVALLDHPDGQAQRQAARLVVATSARAAATALRGLVAAGLDEAVTAALRGVGGVHAEAALAVARNAHGAQRIAATRWATAAGAIPALARLADDLEHQTGPAAQRLCDALLAAPGPERSAALVALLDGPTLKIRLDAAEHLEAEGDAAALAPLDALAGRWFTNRDLKRAAEKAANAIRWRITRSARGALAVHEVGGLSDAD